MIWDAYTAYLEAPPHIVVEWHDPPTGAEGWLVLNSLRGGAAGGGTRMRPSLEREEVVYLSKAMEMKFAFSGPPIGGGKSGIRFDPADPRRVDVLRRWFAAIRPYLTSCYGTGGDVAVDEQRDVVPLCTEIGVAHPQEGVVRGHLGTDRDGARRILGAIHAGVRAPVTGDRGVEGTGLTVSDLITGWGVACAGRRCLENHGESLEGKRVIVEGFGNVGAAAALYMARAGARIVGILDAEYGIAAPDGLGSEEVADLLRRRVGRLLPSHPLRRAGHERDAAYHVAADLFVPAAISGSVGRGRLEALARSGVGAILCGANQPFAERRLGSTELQRAADERFTVVPDVVGSLGMARAFHWFMERGSEGDPTDPLDVFEGVRRTAEEAVDEIVERAGRPRGLLAAAVGIALERRSGDRAG